MPTHGTETSANGGLGAAAKQVAEHASALARLELELAKLELGRKIAALGIGIGLGLGAALFALFAIGFLLAAAAAALATAMSTWLALLLVGLGLFLLTGLLGIRARPDQEGDAAGSRAGDPRGQADPDCAEERCRAITDARLRRSGATSRPSASSSPRRSTSCARRSARRPI